MSKPYIFYIDGMSCMSCSGAIENCLRKNQPFDLEYFHVDLTTPDPKKTTVIFKEHNGEHEDQWNQLKEQIEEIGFECKPYTYEPYQKSIIPTEEKQKSFFTFM